MGQNIFEIGLGTNPANHAPLSPLGMLARAAAVYADRTAIIHGDLRYSWREVDERCRRLASALARVGIGEGDTVSVIAFNGPTIFEAHFGVPMCGAVLNNINYRLDPAQIGFILNHSETKVVFTDTELAPLVSKALTFVKRKLRVIDIMDPTGPGGERLGEIDYESFLQQGSPQYVSDQPRHEGQAISLNYTSGTTGDPKGVVYDHRGALLRALGSMGSLLIWGTTPRPVQLWVVPIFHANGWTYPWAFTALGATNVFIRKPNARVIFRAIADHGVTHMCAAPIIMRMLAGAPEEDRIPIKNTVRFFTAGSPPTASDFSAMKALNIEAMQGYGLTEVFGAAVICEERDDWPELPEDELYRRKARQGFINLNTDGVIVADTETCEPVARDGQTLGEVLFRGNTVMRGYLKNPAATEAAFKGGWFHSGDLAVWHPDGSIELRDRSKDIIISGGENISSIELEEAISAHPAVAGVAVVGRQDEKWGEVPHAFVELHEGASAGADELIAFCAERVARYKIPKGVTFATIPRTSTGKAQKFLLRNQLAQERKTNG